ncbi:MAG: hypothetical protein RQM95_06095 [Syntrophaceticus schinkii]
METKLTRIAEKARENPKLKFTTLVHLINEETLMAAHMMPERKAVGVDGVSKAEYEANLEVNMKDLVARMKRQGLQTASGWASLHSQARKQQNEATGHTGI